MGDWGLFEGEGNARSVICHFFHHMRALKGERGKLG